MSTPITMKFPDDFAELFRDRSDIAGCFPAQRVQALERLVEREGLALKLAEEIAQVRAEADKRLRDGARRGGSVCSSNET